MQRTLIKTADGSHSLYVKELDEHYHSIHGAVQESKHVFIEAGLKYIATQNNAAINILEIGLGTGLNALLTFIEAQKLNISVNYTALEAFPLEPKLVSELNYCQCLGEEKLTDIFTLFHSCDFDKTIHVSPLFNFCKIKNKLQDVRFDDTYHLIYFDAFGPQVQSDLWTEEIFAELVKVVTPGGCLVTYCAKGEVKRTLKKVGLTVQSLPGPPHKREMVRAVNSI